MLSRLVHPLAATLLAAASLGIAPPAARAQLSNVTESFGHYDDATTKASNCYGRGARALKKAQKQLAAGDAEKSRESFLRAKEEFSKAVGFQAGYYEALLGLGQVYLALGQKESALDACAQALAAKPNDPEAQSCADAARNVTAQNQ